MRLLVVFELNIYITGTVFVLPEPVCNETRDDFRGPEFRSRRIHKQHRDNADRRRGKEESYMCNSFALSYKLLHVCIFTCTGVLEVLILWHVIIFNYCERKLLYQNRSDHQSLLFWIEDH